MKAKIRVRGKSQSRTALGIINAYLKLFPDSTLSDLQQAFPKSLNPKSFTDNIIVPEKETAGQEKLFFEREDELVVLKNGEKLALVEAWTKDAFDAICEHAKQYGIAVAELEGTKPFERGSYELEFLDEVVPPEKLALTEEITPEPKNEGKKKRKFAWWWWIILLIVLLLILFFCWKNCCPCNNKCSTTCTAPVENVMPETSDAAEPDMEEAPEPAVNNLINDIGDAVSITLPDGKDLKIDKNSSEYQLFSFLNSDDAVDASDNTKGWITMDKLRFEKGRAKLTGESEAQLNNIAAIMNFFPNAHIKLGGYTDNTGTNESNMRISSERAKIAAEKLIASGVDANRVNHEGYGSQHPVCPENDTDRCRAANRRIDVRVIQK